MKKFGSYCCDGAMRDFSTKKEMVEHYRKEHPEDWYGLYDAIGETWDENLTAAVKMYRDGDDRANESGRLLAAEMERNKTLSQKYELLVQKLNAIRLILRAE